MLANVAQGSDVTTGSGHSRYAWYSPTELLRTVSIRINDCNADDPIESAVIDSLNNKILGKVHEGLIGRTCTRG